MGSVLFYISHVSKLEQWQEQGYFFQYIIVYFFIHELFAIPLTYDVIMTLSIVMECGHHA